jgi:hypothetical protein
VPSAFRRPSEPKRLAWSEALSSAMAAKNCQANSIVPMRTGMKIDASIVNSSA